MNPKHLLLAVVTDGQLVREKFPAMGEAERRARLRCIHS